MKYRYIARDRDGARHEGSAEAAAYEALARQLHGEGLFLVSATEINNAGSAGATGKKKQKARARGRKRGKITRQDLIFFCRQLHFQLNSGIPLLEALYFITAQAEKESMFVMLEKIIEHVRRGQPLSEALNQFPDEIPAVTRNILAAGERSGRFVEVTEQATAYLQRVQETVDTVRSMVIYPLALVLTAASVLFLMLTFVLPRFVLIFAEQAAMLPLPTKMLMAFGTFMGDHTTAAIVAACVALGAMTWAVKQTGKNRTVDDLLISLPVWKSFYRRIILGRICLTASILLESGVDMIASLTIIRGVAGNILVEDAFDAICIDVQKGKTLSDSMVAHEFFPATMVNMIATGEKTGRLAESLKQMSDYYEYELNTALRNLFSIVEPIIILCMGAFIAFIAIGLLLPMFDIYQVGF